MKLNLEQTLDALNKDAEGTFYPTEASDVRYHVMHAQVWVVQVTLPTGAVAHRKIFAQRHEAFDHLLWCAREHRTPTTTITLAVARDGRAVLDGITYSLNAHTVRNLIGD